jgi:putative transposase
MSGKGGCYDIAMVETFFKTVKSELIWHTAFNMRAEATATIDDYIDRVHNPARRHPALAFMSPIQYEMTAAN